MQRSAHMSGLALATALMLASCVSSESTRPDPDPEDDPAANTSSSMRDARAATPTDARVPTGDPGMDAPADRSAAATDRFNSDASARTDVAATTDSRSADTAVRDTGVVDPGTYDPCPAKGTACRVMPLGDSITDGIGSSGGGYRVPLFRLALKDARAITFVGTGTNGPTTVDGQAFPRAHEGHGGYTIDPGGGRLGLSTLVANAITTTKPHIVLLMIGTNDIDIQLDINNAPTRLGALMDKIFVADPKLLLVVAQMVPTGNDAENVRVKAYNDAIPALVKARADAGKHVVMVDMYGGFMANAAYKTAYMSDNLHPKDAGYARMAEIWYPSISPWLK